VANLNYGIKSILCGKIPNGLAEKKCRYLGDNTQECGDKEYIKGMYVQRGYRAGNIGGFVGALETRRDDNEGEYGDQIKGVSCCSL
jgi:hypothetical protein